MLLYNVQYLKARVIYPFATYTNYMTDSLALLPMGAYEPRWFIQYAHMDPEDMVRAYIDLGQPFTVPCHYDVFKLTDEPRGEGLIKLEKAKKFLSVGDKIRSLEPGQFWLVPSANPE